MRRFAFIAASLLLCIGLSCLGGVGVPHFKTERAIAQSIDLGIQTSVPSSASPTWTNTTAAISSSCGFVTTCTITGVAVTTGYVVAGVMGSNSDLVSANFTAMSVCGTSLTLIDATPGAANTWTTSLFGGTVTGGSCSVVVTSSGAYSISIIGIALGTLSNLNSTTPGTYCDGQYPAVQTSPYPCTSGITVSSGGFGIAVFGGNAPSSAPTSSNLTVDSTSDAAAGSVGIGHTTSSITPQFSAPNYYQEGIIAAPWR